MLTQIHNDLWIIKEPLSFLGIDLSRTMSIVRLSDRSLLIYAPFTPSPEILQIITDLGKPSIVISPNPHHNKNAAAFMEFFPRALLLYSGDSYVHSARLNQIVNKEILDPMEIFSWNSTLTLLRIDGMPLVNEYVLYHYPSRTLLSANLLSYIAKGGFLARLFWRWQGITIGSPGQSRMFRTSIRNKYAYNATIDILTSWKIRQAVASQGDLVDAFNIPKMASSLFV